jgi:hypothetical protein
MLMRQAESGVASWLTIGESARGSHEGQPASSSTAWIGRLLNGPERLSFDRGAAIAALLQGRARPLCLSSSDVGLFGDFEGVVHLDAELPHGAFDLGMAKQKLDCPKVAGTLID